MDKLRGMETFIAVVECGSFTGAASRLGLSAVMVGKYIAQLESQLATRLLERNTRRQSLTDAGRVYFDEAKRVMEQVSIAESAVERLRLAPGSSAPAEADAVYRPPSAGNGRRADNDPRVGIITPSAAPAASRQSDREDLRSPPTGGSAAV